MMPWNFKISFYMNSRVDKLSGKRKRVGKFITVGVVVHRDDEHGMTVQGNDGGWNSDGVMLWLGRIQNGYVVEWWGEWPRLE
jgi:hypothetical protein